MILGLKVGIMLGKIIFVLAICMLLASFGSCVRVNSVDKSNLTEASPMLASMLRMSRNTKLADRCTTTDGYTGTCMSRFNCMRQGGAVSGFCGTYGVCCESESFKG